MWKEFKAFIMKGNVIDLAVAVVIGAAFGKIVTSLVDNIIMPCVGVLTSGVDFADMKVILQEATTNSAGEEIPAIAIGYGTLINTILQFLIVAFVIFLIVKIITKARAKAEAIAKKEKALEAAKIAEDIALLTEIRDLLKADSEKGK
jgi:large conductance mechanosensitive channel